MKKEPLRISGIPCILWGDASDKVYICVHGQGGDKEEARFLSGIACGGGWQVISMDLPGHGERKMEGELLRPWDAAAGLQDILGFTRRRWGKAALYATSIGAWLSLQSFAGEVFERCLFVSPVLDMGKLIEGMMAAAGVTRARLEQERFIPTEFGQTLSWEYFLYVRKNPIIQWQSPTRILYAGRDALVGRGDIDAFAGRFGCGVTVMEDGEHWFHTDGQMRFLDGWIRGNCFF